MVCFNSTPKEVKLDARPVLGPHYISLFMISVFLTHVVMFLKFRKLIIALHEYRERQGQDPTPQTPQPVYQ